MPKIIAYTALRYGKDYLAWAIRSVIENVDEYHVLYALSPSHGHSTETECPETRDELYAIAQQMAGDKLCWHDGSWAHEGFQRDSIYTLVPDADVIVVVDSDEVWVDLRSAIERGLCEGKRSYRVPMVHFWRSFHRCMIDDPAYPVRLIFPKQQGEGVLQGAEPMCHFGYAIRPHLMQYKWLIHGHKNEYRPRWFEECYVTNRQTDCHPVSINYWNPVTVDPLDYMPNWMQFHPFFKMEVIE